MTILWLVEGLKWQCFGIKTIKQRPEVWNGNTLACWHLNHEAKANGVHVLPVINWKKWVSNLAYTDFEEGAWISTSWKVCGLTASGGCFLCCPARQVGLFAWAENVSAPHCWSCPSLCGTVLWSVHAAHLFKPVTVSTKKGQDAINTAALYRFSPHCCNNNNRKGFSTSYAFYQQAVQFSKLLFQSLMCVVPALLRQGSLRWRAPSHKGGNSCQNPYVHLLKIIVKNKICLTCLWQSYTT